MIASSELLYFFVYMKGMIMSEQTTINSHDDTKLFIRQWLIPDAKLTVLIVHGLAEHSGRYEHVAQFFNNHGFNVVSFDLRGHGQSGGSRIDIIEFSDLYDDVQTIVEKVVQPLNLPWVMYGHSLGGLITTGYLEDDQRPMPKTAIISSPALGLDVPKPLRIIAKILGTIAPTLRVPGSISGEQLSRDPEVAKKYFADPLVDIRNTARLGKNIFAEQPRVVGLIDRIAIPCLVFHGSDDTLVPPWASELLVKNPNIKRHVYPDMRHECHNEMNKEQVLHDMVQWAKGQVT